MCKCSRDSKVAAVIKFTFGNAGGMVLSVQCRCSTDNLVCTFKDSAAEPIRLIMGIELMKQVIYGGRASKYLENTKSNAERLLSRWEGTRDPETGFSQKSELGVCMKEVIEEAQHAVGRMKSRCLTCNKAKIVTSLP